MTVPIGIQRQRIKGWRKPDNTVIVDRTSKRWGNPCRVGQFKGYTAADAVADYRRWLDRDPVVRSFENVYGKPPTRAEIIEGLKGRNLACTCKLGDPCHRNVLLEIANGPVEHP